MILNSSFRDRCHCLQNHPTLHSVYGYRYEFIESTATQSPRSAVDSAAEPAAAPPSTTIIWWSLRRAESARVLVQRDRPGPGPRSCAKCAKICIHRIIGKPKTGYSVSETPSRPSRRSGLEQHQRGVSCGGGPIWAPRLLGHERFSKSVCGSWLPSTPTRPKLANGFTKGGVVSRQARRSRPENGVSIWESSPPQPRWRRRLRMKW